MDAPNVVFIISDQHRWDFMGCEANGVTHTPNLDSLGVSGVTFRSAYCTSPLCCPSRQAIAGGRYGINSGCFTNLHELPPGSPSFVAQFRQAGYRTYAVGKTHMEIHAYDSDLTADYHREFMDSLGWDEVCETSGNGMLKTGIRCAYSAYLEQHGRMNDVLKFYWQWDPKRTRIDPKVDPYFVSHEWSLPDEFQETSFTGQHVVEWLRGRDHSKPFLMHVGFAAPHSPLQPSRSFLELYRDDEESPPIGALDPSPKLADYRRAYRAMISHIDCEVGRIIDTLAEEEILDNTIVVYVADHGEMAGDHDRFGKTCFYEGSVRVPLLMAGPGIEQGRDTRALVEIIDLGKTLCELCGVEPHALDQGRTLVPMLSGREDSHRDTIYSEMGCDRMLFDGRYKLMWGDPGSDKRHLGTLHLDKPVDVPPSPCRLYDMVEDPHELVDLAGNPNSRKLLAEMKEKLLVRLNENTQTQPNRSRGEYNPRYPTDGMSDGTPVF